MPEKMDVDVQEGIPIHKVEARSGWGSDIADNEVDRARVATDGSVEGTRPGLRVRCQLVRYPPDVEREREQIRITIGGDTEEASSRVQGTAGQGLVCLECICKSRHEMSAFDVNHSVSTRHSPVAMRTRAEPLSTIPAVDDRMTSVP
jgi:hypothetical protein